MNKIDRVDYPIKQLPSGDNLNLSLFRIEGKRPGPHIHIQANVHGAELQGNAVIYHLMNYFSNHTFNGSITFIPCANPAGVNSKLGTYTFGRFNPVTGNNWNRCYEDIMLRPKEAIGRTLKDFVALNLDTAWSELKEKYKKFIFDCLKDYESFLGNKAFNDNKSLFLFLQKVASTADIVLDLHTGPISTQYIYSALYQKESVVNFHFPFVLNIPNEFGGAMDEATFMPWIHLQNVFKDHGKDIPCEFEGYTIELGSEERISILDAWQDTQKILSYLGGKGVIDNPDFDFERPLQRHCLLKDYRTYYAPWGGLVDYHKRPGDLISKDETIASFLNFKNVTSDSGMGNALKELKAENDCFVINHCPSGSVSKGMELYQVMENYQEILPA